MKKEDERQRKIHAESGRNSYAAAVLFISLFLVYTTFQTGKLPQDLLTVFIIIQVIYACSVLYYRKKGVKEGWSLSDLRSD